MNEPNEFEELEGELKTYRPQDPSPDWRESLKRGATPASVESARPASPVTIGLVMALAVCVLVALGTWWFWPAQTTPQIVEESPRSPEELQEPQPHDEQSPQQPFEVKLAHWSITPTGSADFEVIEPTLVRLDRGELLVKSKENKDTRGTRDGAPTSLRIETPQGEAIARGTQFYIGSHQFEEEKERPMLKSLTRVLVLTGVVTLTTALGSVQGTSGDLLAAEGNMAPTRHAIQSNGDFAWDLYQQLAKDNKDENLFFSPYSISSALAMTAEGARGETARQMGAVLRYPGELKYAGDDAQLIPWEMAQIHTGLSELNKRYNVKAKGEETAEVKAARAALAELGPKIETATEALDAADKVNNSLRQWRSTEQDIQRLSKTYNFYKNKKGFAKFAAQLEGRLEGATARLEKMKTDHAQQWEKYQAFKTNNDIPAMKKALAALKKEKRNLSLKIDKYEIRVANALWGEQSYPFRKAYVDTINKHYDTGGVFPVDFRTNHERERLRINEWVEGKTNNLITDLIPQGAITDDTRLVLTNAIYFKGGWHTTFKPENTKDRDFLLANGKKVSHPIMHGDSMEGLRYGAFKKDGQSFSTPKMNNFRGNQKFYSSKEGFAVLEMPYKGNELSMVVIAPNDPANLGTIERQLSRNSVDSWVSKLNEREVHVYMPKFKVETEYTLGDAEEPGALQRMGMKRAFVDPRLDEGARFDGMCESTDPRYRLYITKALHKAFVEVNEEGTEAAAATAVIAAVPSSLTPVPFTPVFKADRPFVYLIRDKATGSVLFVGRMMEPPAGA